MKYCKKCNKEFEKKEESYKGLCFSCYQDYLYDKIDHMGNDNYNIKSHSESIFEKIKNIIKKIFNNEQK